MWIGEGDKETEELSDAGKTIGNQSCAWESKEKSRTAKKQPVSWLSPASPALSKIISGIFFKENSLQGKGSLTTTHQEGEKTSLTRGNQNQEPILFVKIPKLSILPFHFILPTKLCKLGKGYHPCQ